MLLIQNLNYKVGNAIIFLNLGITDTITINSVGYPNDFYLFILFIFVESVDT